MNKYVAVLHAGIVTVHLPHTNGNYYTLCGEDGDDDAASVDQKAVNVPSGAKINCHECLRIWQVCHGFTERDFGAL